MFIFVMRDFRSVDAGGSFDVLILVMTLFVSYLWSVLFGLPYISVLKKKKCLNSIYVVIGGGVLGALAYYITEYGIAALLDSPISGIEHVDSIKWGAFLGVSVALPFSLIAGLPFLYQKKTKK
ncbi:MAG: hypothetical protein COA43_13330 [Robiginitomaculum sp.]|nr:MAG: hypothetical protein COA43_13330 [Robiginitomaculum sp.]